MKIAVEFMGLKYYCAGRCFDEQFDIENTFHTRRNNRSAQVASVCA